MRYTVLRLLKKLELKYDLVDDDDFILLRKHLEPFQGVNKKEMADQIDAIIHEVLKHYCISEEVFFGNCRVAEYVRPRQVAAYLCTKIIGRHSGIIGKQMNRTHGNISYGYRVIRDEMTYNKSLEKEVSTLKETICNQKLSNT